MSAYPYQTVNHDASISAETSPDDPDLVLIQVDVGDRVHIDLEMDADEAAGLSGALVRALEGMGR